MVDTPETEKPGQEGMPYAQAAWDFTKQALSTASEIYIQSDRSAGIKDNYGRNLGVVWYNSGTPQNPDWHLLNYELVRNGLGEPSGIKDLSGNYKKSNVWGNRYMYQWVQDAILYAKTNKLGLYSGVILP
jgi:endonuclease YncB( thermonuclease family)